jgi:hypothetical protein
MARDKIQGELQPFTISVYKSWSLSLIQSARHFITQEEICNSGTNSKHQPLTYQAGE